MNLELIENQAEELRGQLGGKIFAFPLESENPHSKYAVTIFNGAGFITYPDPMIIEDAAAGILATLEGFKEEGWDANYERNVRFISHETQMNAPNVTMRRLKKGSPAGLQTGVDVMPTEDGYNFSARGLLKYSYFLVVDEGNEKAKELMDKYYQLLASRRYGKTAAAIKQEVRKMDKDAGARWIERTYKKFVTDDFEIMAFMKG